MYSIETATLPGELSRPVSPRTVPLPERAPSGDNLTAAQNDEKGAGEEDQGRKASMTKLRRSQQPPCLRSISTSRSRTAGRRQVVSPTSNYMLAVHSLDPRPVEELHNERSYLLYSLQKQDDKAKRLFQKLATLDARISAAKTSSETKRYQREAASITAKIAESTQQEQLMMLRIGELHVELQNRSRWIQVHQLQSHHPPPTMECMGYPSLLCSGEMVVDSYSDNSHNTADYSPRSSPLSPLSPTFTPTGVVTFSEDIWLRASGTSVARETENGTLLPRSADGTEEASQLDPEAVVEEVIPEGGRENDNEVTRSGLDACGDELECEDTHRWRARLRRLSLRFPTSLQVKDRRMSVPYLKNWWPTSRRNSLQSSTAT